LAAAGCGGTQGRVIFALPRVLTLLSLIYLQVAADLLEV
jgi:hypothetical protein